MTTRFAGVALLAGVLVGGSVAAPPPASGPVMPAGGTAPAGPVSLMLTDQFERTADLTDYRGSVVVLVYGDRKGTAACRALGEQLHVCWHPDAKGQPPAKARTAPVAELTGLQPGQGSPEVRVIPVACCGKVPGPVRGAIRCQIAKGSPEVPVWLDFNETMKASFGQSVGEPNIVVFDATGRLRARINGTPDQGGLDQLVRAVQGLRYEAASGK